MTQIHESRGLINEEPAICGHLSKRGGGKQESELTEGTKAAVRHEIGTQAFLAARAALLSSQPASLP